MSERSNLRGRPPSPLLRTLRVPGDKKGPGEDPRDPDSDCRFVHREGEVIKHMDDCQNDTEPYLTCIRGEGTGDGQSSTPGLTRSTRSIGVRRARKIKPTIKTAPLSF